MAVLLAVNPMLIWNAQDARSYALGVLLVTTSIWAFAVARDRRTPPAVAVFAGVSILAGLTHYFTWFVTAPLALVLAWRHLSRRAAVALLAVFAATVGALLPLVHEQAVTKGGTADFGEGGLLRRVAVTVAQFTVGENPPVHSPPPTDLAFRLTGVLVAAVAAVVVIAVLRRGEERGAAGGLLALAACGIVLPFALAVVGLDFYNGRNVMFALVPIILVIGLSLTAREALPRRPRTAAFAVLVVAQLGVVIASTQTAGLQRPDWRDASRLIGRLHPGELLLAPRAGDDPLRLYLDAVDGEGRAAAAVYVLRGPFDDARDPDVVRAPPPGFVARRVGEHDDIAVWRLTAQHARRVDWRDAAPAATAVLTGDAGGR